jgi:hypothetical protein
MSDTHDTPQPKLVIVEPGRHGARLRAAEDDAGENDTGDDTPRRRRTGARAQAATELLDSPHPMLRFSTDDLKAELARRQRQVEYLKLQHGALLRQVAEIEAQMARLTPGGQAGSTPRAPRAPRGPRAAPAENAMSLADAIAQAVNIGDVVTPAQAGERVLASGYKSNAQRFGVLVATALAKDERFVRVGRGQYKRAT